jgi:LysR family transcriptional regulator, carnitine catabolism transcriptional activator
MNPALNLIHLKFFCDAVKYESISEAAKMNYISQSAVSQAITKLEMIFGVQLIFQNRQKLQVTEEGKVVAEQATMIFRAVQNTFEKVNQTKEEVTGTLKFVTTKSLGMSFIAPVYKLIRQKYPSLNFKFRMGGLNLIRTALRHEEAEFAIVVYDHNFEQFAKHPLKKGSLHLYQAKEAAADLLDQGVFVDDYEGMYVKELKEHLEEKGHPQAIQDAIAGWELTARFTQMGLGVGFFPDYIVANDRFPNIDIHPIEYPDFQYEICAIYNKGVKLSQNAQTFLEHFTLE